MTNRVLDWAHRALYIGKCITPAPNPHSSAVPRYDVRDPSHFAPHQASRGIRRGCLLLVNHVKSFMLFGRLVSPRLVAHRTRNRIVRLGLSLAVGAGVASCGSSTPVTPPPPPVGSIVIRPGSFIIERGSHTKLTTTVLNTAGAVVTVPVAWRSLNENIATINANGTVTAIDTGSTFIFASSLGVTSPGIQVLVAWQGPGSIAVSAFTPPAAVSPGAVVDTIRVLVSDIHGKPVPIASLVKFVVTGGGGTVTPVYSTTNQLGIASAVWTLGAALGVNTVSATVVGQDSVPYSFVNPSSTTFSIKTFSALVPVLGDGQTGLILAALPVNPSVKVVDSTGKPRPGVPVKFVPTAGGRVVTGTVSTGADGIASPGVWTLGDIPGDQTLVATADKATVTLHATGTGTPIHFIPRQIATGGSASCAIVTAGTASCWGGQPEMGDSTTLVRYTPTPTKSAVQFVSLVGGTSSLLGHFCGVSDVHTLYCWGTNAVVDTAGKVFTKLVPTLLPSNVSWTASAPGQLHTCALASDGTVHCWGDNSVGQLGDRSTTTRFVPAPVYGGFQFTTVVSGAGHSCALAADGSAFCWGQNPFGQLGDGSTTSRLSPTAVTGGINFQSLGAGLGWTCGLTPTGKVYCWGNLLFPGSTAISSPRLYTTTQTFKSLSVGGGHACALATDGTAYCWGSNGFGQLGDSSVVDRQNPVPVSSALKFNSISTGFRHTCAAALDGAIACWGDNTAGQLADSTVAIRITPRLIVTGVTP